MPHVLQLGDRAYQSFHTGSVLHDVHARAVMSEAGLLSVTIWDDEHPGDFALRFLDQLNRSRKTLEVLACYMVPIGMTALEWTPELAAETVRYLGSLPITREWEALRDSMILEVVTGFFHSGRVSLWSSPRSFATRTMDRGAMETESAKPHRPSYMETGPT